MTKSTLNGCSFFIFYEQVTPAIFGAGIFSASLLLGPNCK